MTRLKPTDKVVAWKCKDMCERIRSCAAMLNIHEFMTDAERAKVQRRIKAWEQKHDKGGAT